MKAWSIRNPAGKLLAEHTTTNEARTTSEARTLSRFHSKEYKVVPVVLEEQRVILTWAFEMALNMLAAYKSDPDDFDAPEAWDALLSEAE